MNDKGTKIMQLTDTPIIRVRDVMKHEFDMVDGLDTVADALRSMEHPQNKCLIVNKRHADDEYGIVLFSTIARKVLAVDRAPERINIYEIMAKPVLTVDASMNIRYCARMFAHFNLSRAPVAENGELVGVVSYTDLVIKGLIGIESE